MQIREYDGIDKQGLRQPPFYTRWFCCLNKACRTSLTTKQTGCSSTDYAAGSGVQAYWLGRSLPRGIAERQRSGSLRQLGNIRRDAPRLFYLGKLNQSPDFALAKLPSSQ
jgi:hypothetical protein